MIKPICRDIILLGQKAAPASVEDLSVLHDLMETLEAHRDGCVGMAANMIGVPKKIIAFYDGDEMIGMLNPEIIKQSAPFEAEEGCLSLDGTRKTKRFRSIKVRWQNERMETRIRTFTGWTAQIIQHEVDHLSGIII